MDISLSMHFNLVEQATTKKQLYRVKHDIELSSGVRACAPCPEVYPLNAERTPFTSEWQHLAYALNPGMTGNHWRSLYGNTTAFTNGNGFPTLADPRPHADYITMQDLTAPQAAFDKTRLCGGATVTGVENGTDLIVDILNGFGPVPSVAELLAQPTLFFHAVICNLTYIQRFPQMNGGIVLVPLLGSGVCRYPLAGLEKVDLIADPYYLGYRPSPYVYG